ncbi:DEAD/DEAH box helicase [Tuwongella immobilis]|uniref:Helicase ATP-binding domain-containing protein n=1 Tax=Tuwongella immobilis TaxID=692036 RepID=A0A6C2YMT4_9BACT|nr:DEAD/DEAH box helicase [Tuwongella immobilis]VIP02423.1 dead deah box helicase domain protein : Helicase OS=uncultured planctomycete GN=HGMM_F01A04C03 PE=4 SV=1: DEAD: Helicase_C [Tuwongella immobilis]VTS01353.1 dead deah box helicase domain protein : Helicase OS=uncultured planctomycete GN=HGMM_F01A04C03 PE=4 SV=1: DEAD: Helicase_C [Tuwongella immobilis]
MAPIPDREQLLTEYLGMIPYTPYPLQEDAILNWFTAENGVLVCAPTGTGKTLIAQAALYEALRTDTVAYYTTPLIALSEQKFAEMQDAAELWGFSRDDVGLITGNRRVNPGARVLVVVAEILLNRLLNPEDLDWGRVSAVVMDEFHSFADPQRGIVWELSLSMLPKHIRLLLLSATVGNSVEFTNWLDRVHGRKLELVEGTERKVPLSYRWVPDQFLDELLLDMTKGDPTIRHTPALVFCFNRDECWSVAEMLKGKDLLHPSQRQPLLDHIEGLDWTQGVGPKLKQMLRRGVGVHHAGLLPVYRRKVEELFEQKLLSVAVCTETLAAGINLPARSVVLTSLMKGPFGGEKLIDASTAHQIFGRAGRPQYDTQGFVYALAHEDDVRILRWKRQYELIPEDTKDPMLIRKKKELKRKKPTRNEKRQYWTDQHFDKLQNAPPGKLYSKGQIPWRLLAYLLKLSPEVSVVRGVIRKRMLDEPRIIAAQKNLESMLRTLHEMGYITLDPPPPVIDPESKSPPPPYESVLAHANPTLDRLLVFRSVHPLYGAFLADQLGIASRMERIQAFESVLELPRPLLKFVRVPWEMAPGPLTRDRLDPELIARGLMATKPEPSADDDTDDSFGEDEFIPWEDRPPHFAEKLRMYFEALRPEVTDVSATAVWAAGSLMSDFAGNFNLYVRTRDLIKQEGIIFRHLLRMILLIQEFLQVTPSEGDPLDWQTDLEDLVNHLTATCREVDPTSTEETITRAHAADAIEGERGKLP